MLDFLKIKLCLMRKFDLKRSGLEPGRGGTGESSRKDWHHEWEGGSLNFNSLNFYGLRSLPVWSLGSR